MLVELFGATEKTCCHVLRTSFAKARKSVLSVANSYLQNGMTREIFLSCQQMCCQAGLPVLYHDKGTAIILILRSLVLQMFTPLTWEVLTEPINFVLFILRVILPESGITTFFWFLFNLSICNASFHRATRGQRKQEMINFRLDLAKQLIDGFSQRQRKRRSQEPQQHSVVRAAHVSVHVEGRKRKCVLCSKAGRRTPKGYKVETRFECSLCKVALCRTMCHNLFHDQAE